MTKEELRKEATMTVEWECTPIADCNTCNSTCKTENIEMKKQLTKAKEILKEFSEFINNEIKFDLE